MTRLADREGIGIWLRVEGFVGTGHGPGTRSAAQGAGHGSHDGLQGTPKREIFHGPAGNSALFVQR